MGSIDIILGLEAFILLKWHKVDFKCERLIKHISGMTNTILMEQTVIQS